MLNDSTSNHFSWFFDCIVDLKTWMPAELSHGNGFAIREFVNPTWKTSSTRLLLLSTLKLLKTSRDDNGNSDIGLRNKYWHYLFLVPRSSSHLWNKNTISRERRITKDICLIIWERETSVELCAQFSECLSKKEWNSWSKINCAVGLLYELRNYERKY
jgi:hypothetical protein